MMVRIRLSIISAVVLTACVGAGTARADDPAINVTVRINPQAGSVQPFNYTQGSYISGFAFRVNTAISITHLGYYDSNLTSAVETFRATPEGVYDLPTNTLLPSTTVNA